MRTHGDRPLLEAACDGDGEAFARLVGPLNGELQAHCRRMLRSPDDAEDAVQETLLRAWRALPRFEGRSSLRAWLYRIATNACLTAIARRRRRVPPVDADAHDSAVEPAFESLWPEPERVAELEDVGGSTVDAGYERREAAEMALAAAVDVLPARQRAALILRDVLGYSARETATALGTTTASVNSALQRARAALEGVVGERGSGRWDPALRGAVGDCMTAVERGDLEGLVAMLTAPPHAARHWSYAPGPAY